MITAAIVRELIRAGLSGEPLIAALERIEADAPRAAVGSDTAAERRRAWDREYRRGKRAPAVACPPDNPPDKVDISQGAYPPDIHPTSTRHPPDAAASRVEDNPLTTSLAGFGGGVGCAHAREVSPQTDDWPSGDLVDALVAEIASPWLDPTKSPGLITTGGRLTAWRREGASWLHDVVPVVRGLCASRNQLVTSWKFFDAAIGRSIADNRRALEIPEATGPPRLVSLTDRITAEKAEARRRTLKMLGAASG